MINFFIIGTVIMKNLLLILSISLIIAACSSSNDPVQEMPPTELNSLKIWVNSDMSSLNAKLKRYADSIKVNPTDTTNIRKAMQQLFGQLEFGFDITFISPENIITMVEPPEYSAVINKDLSDDENLLLMLQRKDLTFGSLFPANEGIWGAMVACPIYQDDQFLGALSVLIDLNEYLKDLIADLKLKEGLHISVFEKSGTVLVGRKNEELGKNIFFDEYYDDYPDFRSVCEKAAQSISGDSEYEYTNEQGQKKIREVYWNTISLYGIQWKILSEQD